MVKWVQQNGEHPAHPVLDVLRMEGDQRGVPGDVGLAMAPDLTAGLVGVVRSQRQGQHDHQTKYQGDRLQTQQKEAV